MLCLGPYHGFVGNLWNYLGNLIVFCDCHDFYGFLKLPPIPLRKHTKHLGTHTASLYCCVHIVLTLGHGLRLAGHPFLLLNSWDFASQLATPSGKFQPAQPTQPIRPAEPVQPAQPA